MGCIHLKVCLGTDRYHGTVGTEQFDHVAIAGIARVGQQNVIPGIDQIIIYLVAIIVLLTRPRGLMGRKGVMEE